MDDVRLESLLKALGEGTSRRGTLSLLGGLGLAMLPGISVARSKHRSQGKRKSKSRKQDAKVAAQAQSGRGGVGVYETLATKWWAWVIGEDFAPIVERGAVDCTAGQQGNTWFLSGSTFSRRAISRSCTVPAGTQLFFPVVNAFCAEFPATFKMQLSELRACAAKEIDVFAQSDLTATVDGVAVPMVRAQSALFPLHLGESNPFGAPAGTYQETADGYWVLLDPLPAGEHRIHFAASPVVDVTYTLTIA